MVVEPHELGSRVGLRQDDRRRAVTAADIGHQGAFAQLGLDPVERGDPLRNEVRQVVRAEEALGALEEVGAVFVPAESLSGAERLDDPGFVEDHGPDDLVGARQVGRAVFDGERERLFGRQRYSGGRGVIST
jgi:hypothetical protein